MAFHHVAFATRDLDATHEFHGGFMGFPLVHSEFKQAPGRRRPDRQLVKHVFYDTDDGGCVALFALENMGEDPMRAPT